MCAGKFYGDDVPQDEKLLSDIGFVAANEERTRWRLGPFKCYDDAISAAKALGAQPMTLSQLLIEDKYVRKCIQRSDEAYDAFINLQKAEGLP